MTSPEAKIFYSGPEKQEFQSTTAIIYPGQGSQHVGMGEEAYRRIARVRKVYLTTDRIFSRNQDPEDPTISTVSFYGPPEKLTDTYYTQGAILAHNHACAEVLKKIKERDFTEARFVAGMSIGEYNALATSGVMSFKDAAKLVRERGRLMQIIDEINPGGQLALPLSESDERLQEVLARFNLEISLINTPNQTIVGGTIKSLEEFAKSPWAKENNIRGVRLRTRGAFHTSIMADAVNPFYKELKSVKFRHPNVSIIGNTTAQPLAEPEEFIEELLNHFTEPVRWMASVKYMFDRGVIRTIEVGSDQGILSKFNEQLNEGGVIESIKGLFTRYDKSPQTA